MTEFQKGLMVAHSIKFALLRKFIETPRERRYGIVDLLLNRESELIDDYLSDKSDEFKNGFESVFDQMVEVEEFVDQWMSARIGDAMENFGGFIVEQ